MSGRLKDRMANYVHPDVHDRVTDLVFNPDRAKEQDRDEAYLLADKLFDDSNAYIQSSYAIGKFADAIREGKYDYISSIQDARNHWDKWLSELHSFLAKIKVASKKKRSQIKKK